MKNKKGQIIYV